jgi:butyryl-CoA dehydrogenase
VRREIAAARAVAQRLGKDGDDTFGLSAPRLREAVEAWDRATSFLLKALRGNSTEDALAGATPYLRLFALARGGAALGEGALASAALMKAGDGDPAHPARIALCRFFAENLLTGAKGLEDTVATGAAFVHDAPLALAS